VIQHPDAPAARDAVAIEREVDLLDASALRAGAKRSFSAWRAAAEEDAV
jgi:hypothetical protein